METSITVERLAEDETEFLPSHEILRENLKRRRRKVPKNFTEFKCDICKKVFAKKEGLTNHKTIHQTDSPYQCEQCSYKCKNRKYLSRHVLKVHNKARKSQTCNICGKNFFFKCNLDAHLRTHTGERPFKCDVCGQGFNWSYCLKTHKLIHTNEKPYKCSFCDYACRDSSTLRKHHSNHLGIRKRYKCEKCPNGYNTKSRLQAHVTQKHSDAADTKILSCDRCDTKFKNKWTLVKHIKTVHEKANSCTCDICGRHISNIDNLKAHLRVHVDARPYHCAYEGCNMKFKDNNCLKKHSLLHYPSQQLSCPDCGRKFPRRHRLMRHLEKKGAGPCPKYQKQRRKKLYKTHKERDPNRPELICDTCGYTTTSRSKLVTHMQYGHGSVEDLECKICRKTFRKNDYLKLHYWNMHKVKYKAKIVKLRPMVVIKQERLDDEDLFADLGLELMDIKEEPFADTQSAFSQEGVISELPNEEEEIRTENEQEKNGEETEEINAGEQSENPVVIDTPSENPTPSEDPTPSEKLTPSENLTPPLQDTTDNLPSEEQEGTLQSEAMDQSERPSIQMKDFIQHIILAEQSDEEIEKEDSERYVQKCLRVLMEKANKSNASRFRNNSGRKLKRIEDEEATKLILERCKPEEEASKEVEGIPEVSKQKKNKRKDKKQKERTAKGRKPRSGSKDKKVQYSKQKPKKTEKGETEVSEKDNNSSSNGIKIKFNLQQCYVCYKLFNTKPELIEHCKIHFDVCNEVTLKKCPLCPYVTHKNIKRHVRLVHNLNINFSFMRIKDKIDNQNGSRYYFDINDDNLKKMEIVPSIKILNKKACMELDKKNRELKNKSVLKRKLVKKGTEWVVEHEKVDLSGRVIPNLKKDMPDLKEDYLQSLRKLSIENKKKGVQMLFPCNVCDKVCQNLSALTLHLRTHDPNAKPFKPKIWKHKVKDNYKNKTEDKNKDLDTVAYSIENRTANPKPIVNKHKCDPKLKDFYEKNIKGGDIEFWQFLKIYNKMSRENVNDFKDLEGRTEFGVHLSQENVNNIDDDDVPLNELLTYKSDEETPLNEVKDKNEKEASINEIHDKNKKPTNRSKSNKVKGIRNVISKRNIELSRIRNAAKAKLRDNIAKNIS